MASLVIIRVAKTLSPLAGCLHQRGNAYYFQLRVPQDLIGRYPKQVIRESLRMSDAREAVRITDGLFQ